MTNNFLSTMKQLLAFTGLPKKRRPAVRPTGSESLEIRQVMTASMIGAVSQSGQWQFDLSHDGNVDADRQFGLANDQFVIGNWNGTGDQPGVVRKDGLYLRWYLNTDAEVSPVQEIDYLFGLATDTAVAGDWNNDGKTEAGIVRVNGNGLDWMLDTNRDPSPERVQAFGLAGDTPVVGDWDNNGSANPGVVRVQNGSLVWHMDVTGDHLPEVSRIFGLAGDKPIVGDWNDDGRIDIGVARQIPGSQEYQLLLDTNGDTQPDMSNRVFSATQNSKFITGRFQLAEVSVLPEGQTTAGATAAATYEIQDGTTQPISFGKVLIGSAEPGMTFVIRNTGNIPMQIADFRIPNGFELGDDIPAIINPLNSIRVGIKLKTTIAGAYSGDISFRTNDGNETPFNFAIVGVVESIRPEIRVTGDTAFGKVLAATTAPERSFRIENPGNSPLTYSAVLSNSDFTIASGGSAVVSSGGHQIVVVRMNSTSVGVKSAVLTLTSDAVNSPSVRLNLAGEVEARLPRIAISGSGAFGTVAQESTGASTLRTFTIKNDGNCDLTYTASIHNTAFTIVSGGAGTIAKGASTSLIVRMKTSVAQAYSGRLTVTSNSVVSPTTQIQLTGTVVSLPVISFTGNGAFGNIDQGTMTERQITITNSGTAPLTFSTTLVGSGFTVVSGQQGTVAARGGKVVITVRVDTSVSGSKSGELRIVSNDPLRPSLSIPLSAKVVVPEISVTAGGTTLSPGQTGLLHFGATAGQNLTQSFRVHNTGDGPLRISNVRITGGQFSHNMPSTLEIPGGQGREFTVTMNSSSIGTKVGSLYFNTNDSDESLVKINLLGRLLERVTFVGGSVNRDLRHGVFEYFATNRDTIYIDPSWGNTATGGVYALSNRSLKDTFSGDLRTIIIHSDVRPDVQNWTSSVTVIWQKGTTQRLMPLVRDRLDLFAGL